MNYKNKSKNFLTKKILISLLAIFLIVVCIAPLFYIVWNTPKTKEEFLRSKFDAPTNFNKLSENINKVVSKGFLRAILNTIIIVIVAVVLTTIFSSMAGYAFDKLQFPGRKIFYWFTISLLAMPTQVFIIPLFVMFSRLNLINNLFALAAIYSTFSFSFGAFLMKSFYNGIPNELIDSAKIDGANSFQTFLKIMVPLGKPAIITLSVMNFFGFWNELFLALIFLQNTKTRVISPFLSMFVQGAKASALTDWPMLYTAMFGSLLIPLIVYFIFQNRLVSGLTVGALKG